MTSLTSKACSGRISGGICVRGVSAWNLLSGQAALEQVKAIPDPSLILILSDVNMPGMTGLEMLPKVKAERPNVPVIMITAYADDATKKKATELGAAGLLPKPLEFGLLRQEIDQRLQKLA
jgi:CheY-like chemotaxis protein